jgi:transposase
MARTHGRAPKGHRCVAAVPHGHWQSTTFIAGLRINALTAPMVLDGPMDGAAFQGYVRNFLCPTLQPGDIVIADNLPSHKVAGIKPTIEAAGASLRHLPAYSPDFNPIENLFAKLKALLKKAAHRTVEALCQEIGTLLDDFSPDECAHYFKAAGYNV